MNSINIKEMNLIQNWVQSHENRELYDEYLAKQDGNTYFIDVQADGTDIMEYDFQNIGELEKLFEKHWRSNTDSLIRKMAAIAAFKYQQQAYEASKNDAKQSEISKNSESQLPEYIYVF